MTTEHAPREDSPSEPAPRPSQSDDQGQGGNTATLVRTRTAPPKVDRMPQWKVLLHNDDVNDVFYVVEAIQQITSLRREEAAVRMAEAHKTGVALLLATHREHAELLQEQFQSKRLTVTIEPD